MVVVFDLRTDGLGQIELPAYVHSENSDPATHF